MTDLPAHSKLGASSASRWMACPGSVALNARMPKRTSVFAAEGTAAHTVGEACLKRGFDADQYIGEVIEVEGCDEKFTVDEDMAEAVQVYLDAVRAECTDPTDILSIEQRFHLKDLHPLFFGTNDACVYKPKKRELVVFDYKHGKGVAVEVERNKQMMYYALGASIEDNRPIVAVKIVVIQPRCPHKHGPVRAWSTTPMDLIDFAAEIIAAAKATEQPNAPLASGDHCKFCSASPVCPRLRDDALEAAQVEFGANSGEPILRQPDQMTPDEVGSVLRQANTIKTWFRAVEEFGNAEARRGQVPTGFKLVEGKGRRKWRDENDAIVFLKKQGVEDEHIYEDPSVRSPAQTEAMLKKHYGYKGKKANELVAALIATPPGKTQLVPLDDERAEVRRDPDADFT